MRKILTIYSIILLSGGNLVSFHIHIEHEHEKTHNTNEHRCIECLTIDNSNQFISFANKYIFYEYRYNFFIFKKIDIHRLFDLLKAPSRSPPFT